MPNKHKHLDELRRQRDAAIRQEERDHRTDAEQLALISKRRGNSAKERAKLEANGDTDG